MPTPSTSARSCPPPGHRPRPINASENAGELVGPHLCGDPAALGALRLDPRSADGTYTAGIRECFYNDVEPGPAAAAMALLSTDAPIGIAGGTTILDAKAWGAVPRTYVYCARDNAIRPPLQRRMIAEADLAFPGNPTTVVELDASHSPFLSRPGELADIVETPTADRCHPSPADLGRVLDR